MKMREFFNLQVLVLCAAAASAGCGVESEIEEDTAPAVVEAAAVQEQSQQQADEKGLVSGREIMTPPLGAVCRWRGTAPACEGECLPDENEVKRDDCTRESCGKVCITGSKAYCCRE